MLQVRRVILADDPPKAVRRLQEVDRAFAVIKTAVQTDTPAVLHQRGEIGRVRLDADSLPAEGFLQELCVALLRSVRGSGIQEEAIAHLPEHLEDKAILAILRGDALCSFRSGVNRPTSR